MRRLSFGRQLALDTLVGIASGTITVRLLDPTYAWNDGTDVCFVASNGLVFSAFNDNDCLDYLNYAVDVGGVLFDYTGSRSKSWEPSRLLERPEHDGLEAALKKAV